MNIVIFNWRDPKHPNAGGAEIVTREHAKAWVKAGHHVTLFSSYYKGAKRKENLDGVLIIRRGDPVFGVQISAFFWYLFGKHEKFDLVIDQFHGIPFFTPLYVKTKKLAFIHEVTKNVWKLNPWPKPFNLIPYVFGVILEPWIFKLFYAHVPFFTVSESTKEDLIKWGIKEKNINVIHSGIFTMPQKPPIQKNKNKTIMFLGALAYDKGVEDALKVFATIQKQEPGWEFWIAGRGDTRYMKKLKSLSSNLFLKNLTFFGFVSEKKKFELLAKSHIVINPSVREGWGLVNIEANSVGTPVIAYDVAGSKDSIKNNETGILVEFGSYEDMAEKCISIIYDRALYNRLSKNCLKWSKQFTWEKATKNSLTLIEKQYKL